MPSPAQSAEAFNFEVHVYVMDLCMKDRKYDKRRVTSGVKTTAVA